MTLSSIIRHLRDRTLLSAARRRLGFGPHLQASPAVSDRWNISSREEAIDFLVTRATDLVHRTDKTTILGVTDWPERTHPVVQRLTEGGFLVLFENPSTLLNTALGPDRLACILCLDFNSRTATRTAQAIQSNINLQGVSYEYAVIPEEDYRTLLRYDSPHYSPTYFKSPLLVDEIDAFNIYERALEHFELKCDIRDFSELFQLLTNVVRGNIEGDVAEFGSFKGHSGYLISQSLRALSSDKHVYMFDTFEHFPKEALGIDAFWSGTHPVQYDDVLRKFKNISNVTLVKGEFTDTLPKTSIKKLSLVYVDCDSYRATKYVIEQVYPILSSGGVMAFEDYGAPALLGARLAVDECFAQSRDCFKYFSQFTGFYIVVKR